MRDTTVLRRLLAIPEVRVIGVGLSVEGLIVDVRLRKAARLRCPSCAFTTRSAYDRRPERLWRHLDLGGRRCWLRMPLRRLACPDHGVVTEAVPFAPAHSGYSAAFEDQVAWQAQRSDQTTITRLLRVSWRSVGKIIERWTARHRQADALAGIVRAGVDDKGLATRPPLREPGRRPRPRRARGLDGRGPHGGDARRILQGTRA